MESSAYPITPAVVRQRRDAATIHGAKSDVRVRDVARAQKRRILRKLGLSAGDLDAISAVYVDVLARSLGKIALLDIYYAENGIVRADGQGEPTLGFYIYYAENGIVRADGQGEPTLGFYMSALNQARLTAWKLAEHLERQDLNAPSLDDYIDATYGHDAADAHA